MVPSSRAPSLVARLLDLGAPRRLRLAPRGRSGSRRGVRWSPSPAPSGGANHCALDFRRTPAARSLSLGQATQQRLALRAARLCTRLLWCSCHHSIGLHLRIRALLRLQVRSRSLVNVQHHLGRGGGGSAEHAIPRSTHHAPGRPYHASRRAACARARLLLLLLLHGAV
jgi:hypothetical protein